VGLRNAVTRFEEEYAAFRRQKTIYNSLFWVVFMACVIAAGVTASFVLTNVRLEG
jgi:hypothetical protein